MAIRTQWDLAYNSERWFHRFERRHGAFRRSMTVPVHVLVEVIEASTDSAVPQVVAQGGPRQAQQHIAMIPSGEVPGTRPT
jgi:HSP20 family molecular chaperone IbpA